MATMYKYGDTGIYTELTGSNMNYGIAYSTRALENASNKGMTWNVTPGDQIRFCIYTSNARPVKEIPSSGSTTTNEWFWGSVTSLTSGQVVRPLVDTTYVVADNYYYATIPTNGNYFVVVTASSTYVNTQLSGPVEKYVEGKGWIPVEPYQYDGNNNSWQTSNAYKSANNIWS